MTNLKTSSMAFSAVIPKWIVALALFIALVGFIDAVYLTVKHYSGGVNCSLIEGCEEVTTSKYSVIGGAPIALFGAIYYAAILITAFAYLDTKKVFFLKGISFLSAAGFLVSLGLVYLQIFIIKAICLYCLISAASSTGLFVLGLIIFKKVYDFRV